MDALTFFGLHQGSDPTRWHMPIVPGLVSGRGTLFGGCGLGAGIEVAEQTTGRPVVWATAQYLSFARPGDLMELDVYEVVRGHQTSQVRVIARVGDEEILTVLAALGRRPFEMSGQWARHPEVPAAADCPRRHLLPRHDGTMMSRLEMRLAQARAMEDLSGAPGDGNSSVWVRLPDGLDVTPASLAIIGDLVPFGMGQALGRRAGGSSLDNTLRAACRAPTEWVLADVRVHAIAGGYGHGVVYLWTEDGVLLGAASQSVAARMWQDEVPMTEEVVR